MQFQSCPSPPATSLYLSGRPPVPTHTFLFPGLQPRGGRRPLGGLTLGCYSTPVSRHFHFSARGKLFTTNLCLIPSKRNKTTLPSVHAVWLCLKYKQTCGLFVFGKACNLLTTLSIYKSRSWHERTQADRPKS